MSTRRTAVLVAASMLAVSTAVVGCAAHKGSASDPEKEKLKVKVDVDHTLVDPLKSVKIGGKDADAAPLPACTQNDISGGRCQRPGYPLTKDGSAELLGKLSRDPILILTDVASPGQTCVCYGNRCYCR